MVLIDGSGSSAQNLKKIMVMVKIDGASKWHYCEDVQGENAHVSYDSIEEGRVQDRKHNAKRAEDLHKRNEDPNFYLPAGNTLPRASILCRQLQC